MPIGSEKSQFKALWKHVSLCAFSRHVHCFDQAHPGSLESYALKLCSIIRRAACKSAGQTVVSESVLMMLNSLEGDNWAATEDLVDPL